MTEPADHAETTLGASLAAMRREAGLSQEFMAALFGVTPRAVRYWERDKRAPTWAVVRRWARECGWELGLVRRASLAGPVAEGDAGEPGAEGAESPGTEGAESPGTEGAESPDDDTTEEVERG